MYNIIFPIFPNLFYVSNIDELLILTTGQETVSVQPKEKAFCEDKFIKTTFFALKLHISTFNWTDTYKVVHNIARRLQKIRVIIRSEF